MRRTVLIIEDDPAIRGKVGWGKMTRNGFTVSEGTVS